MHFRLSVIGFLLLHLSLHVRPDGGDEAQELASRDRCVSQWREDELVGRCFGIGQYHKVFPRLAGRRVRTAEQCQRLCCKLGPKCITWQVRCLQTKQTF